MGQWFGMKEGIVSCRGKAAPPLEHACWGRWTLVGVPGDENWEEFSGDTLGDVGERRMTTLGSWMAF